MNIAKKVQVISDNNVIIAENQEKVYEAGKSSMIDPDKIIEKTATGTGIVALDDVSELPHDISVQLSGENVGGKKVTVCGKNLLNENAVSQTVITESGILRYGWRFENLTEGEYTLSSFGTYTAGTLTYKTFKDGVYSQYISIGSSKYENISISKGQGLVVYLYQDYNQLPQGVNLQLEARPYRTEYEPYIEPTEYTTNADGKVEVKSLSPYMTFICNETDISVTYHKSWGMQTEYDEFWDAYQEFGKRTNYAQAFYSVGWTDATYNPKYDIVPAGNGMNIFGYSLITDTKVTINISQETKTASIFHSCKNLKTIRKLIVSENTSYATMFSNCTALENITFEGVIGNDINFQWCPLSRESILNIFEHLSTTASGVTVTFKKSAVESAFTDAEWDELVATRPNWTVSKA
jgi:hypothetical protein